MRIGLIDVDGHNFPNLCLMKISSYHKKQGNFVEWYKENSLIEEVPIYDIVYMSKVFSNTYTKDYPLPVYAKQVIKGGTGYAITLEKGIEVYHPELDPPLPDEIETAYPDYSLYPQYTGYGKPLKEQTAYGFLTRGCPRNCAFCHVGKKEGLCSKHVSQLKDFWNGQGHICLSDPNILACKERKALLSELIETKAEIDFNQGIDARLIDSQIAELLAGMKLKLPHFAMDRMDNMYSVKQGLRAYVSAYKRKHGSWNWRNAKVFVLTNFDTSFDEDMERLEVIKECECWPYVMIYNKPSAPSILRRLQRYTNNSEAYSSSKDFYDYQKHTYKNILLWK